MILGFLLMLAALLATAPGLGQYSSVNRCTVVNQRAEQVWGPCKWDEVASWRVFEPEWRAR